MVNEKSRMKGRNKKKEEYDEQEVKEKGWKEDEAEDEMEMKDVEMEQDDGEKKK